MRSEPFTDVEWDDYPSACRERFQALATKAQTASEGARRHFVYPKCDEVLDAYLLWLAIEQSLNLD